MLFFFFNDTATTEIYTLSLHDALPILSTSSTATRRARRASSSASSSASPSTATRSRPNLTRTKTDRKSTRLNSSHSQISYAVFCLKKKQRQHSVDLPQSHTYTCRHGTY